MNASETMLDSDCLQTIRLWAGQVNRTIKSSVSYRGIKCTITLEPCEVATVPTAYIPGDDCKRDCLEILRDVGQGLTQPQMLELFEARGIIHSPRTLAQAMTDLVKAGDLLGPRRGSSDGYRFPGTADCQCHADRRQTNNLSTVARC